MEMRASDQLLLRQYVENNSEEAFAELVARYINLVYSAALRQVHAPQLAEEVAQSVFIDLARNMARLKPDTLLTAWLYQVTRRTAIDTIRRESRRQLREKTAVEMNAMNAANPDWNQIEPLLDDALDLLDETDRAAILLRYFENKSLREVGRTLGASDDAAQKRVSRAVERLREFFVKRGVSASAAGLTVVVSTHAVQAAPVGLAPSISTAAVATAAAGQVAGPFFKGLFLMSKAKTILVGALILGAGTLIILEHQTNTRLRSQLREAQEANLAATGTAGPAISTAPANEKPQVANASGRAEAAVLAPPNLSAENIMQRAIALTGGGKSREDAVKEIEPLLAQIPLADLKAAADTAMRIPDRNWRTGFLHMLLRRWAESGGPAALDYIVQNIKGESQWPLVAGVLPVWAAHNPEEAWNWFQTTARQELQFDARGRQNAVIGEMFTAMGQSDFDRGLGHAVELQGIDLVNAFAGLMQGAQTRGQRWQLLTKADGLEDVTDRRNARQSLLNVLAGAQPDEARAYVEGLADFSQRSESARFVGPAFLGANPEAGAQWWLNQTAAADRPRAMNEIIQQWAEVDLPGAARWLQSFGNGAEMDASKRAFALAAMMRAPEAAMNWATAIADQEKRLQTMREVYTVWHGSNREQVERWLAGAGLTPTVVAAITRQTP